MGGPIEDPPESDKRNNKKIHNGEEINANNIIEDFEGEDLSEFLEWPLKVTSISLPTKILEIYKGPGLKYKLAARVRWLLAQDLSHNGYSAETAKQKLKKIDEEIRDREAIRTTLQDIVNKNFQDVMKRSDDKAEKRKQKDDFKRFIDNESGEYDDQLEDLLKSGKKRSVAERQIKDRINTKLRPDIKETFKKDYTANELFNMMNLGDVKP